ncbi:MFS transporter [Pilimelia anulata]|uniref:MFS transporter n=1 Tax=Pilimelia anulata TaxID=53371 RepID=A0A8J3F7Z6_9ACTN|nr:MFS transporter [Pilimelia anulata]GGJ75023.1 MFS transporter [Pilimelia anulata]
MTLRETEPTAPADARRRPGIGPLLVAVLVLYSAQQLLTPMMAPLARRLALTESQLGLVVTVAAAALTLSSPLWGRALDAKGVRTVLLSGIGLATVGLAGFAAASVLALRGHAGVGATMTAFLVFRSLLFGAGIAAVPVAALAVAAATADDEATRTKWVSLVGAAQGLSLVLGPAAGGALAAVALVLPLYVAPAVAAILLAVVVATVPRHTPVARPAERRRAPWRPMLPALSVGFLLYLSLSVIQVVVGFLVADRLGLSPEGTAGAVGVALLATGLVLVAVQAAVVPKLAWPPHRMVRVGAAIAALAYLGLAAAGTLPTITAACVALAVGLGLGFPGFTIAATAAAPAADQGAAAGLVSATMGATFIVGPLLGTALYEVRPGLPVLVAAGCAAAGLLVALRRTALRGPAAPVPDAPVGA